MSETPLTKPVIFGSACVGGVVAWAIIHPFNTIAVRMNLATSAGAAPPSSFLAYTADMIRSEGKRRRSRRRGPNSGSRQHAPALAALAFEI